jgi:hypothetical protein
MKVLNMAFVSGMYHHSPPSGLESGQPSITDFYRPDEVKYHGKGNRGVVTMNFFGKYFVISFFSRAFIVQHLSVEVVI